VSLGLSLPYNKIFIFNFDLKPPPPPKQKKSSYHFVGKSVCTFQHMQEEKIYLPLQDLQEIFQPIFLFLFKQE
jgi:hypothetical protein